MIVVKIELHSAVTGEVSEIGRMLIANVGGDITRGEYDVKVLRRGCETVNWRHCQTTREGHVSNYPRLSYNVWRLISRAIRSAFPEEK